MTSSRVGKTCSFEGCGRPLWSKGYCNPHYSQQRRGLPLKALKPYVGSAICEIQGCGAVKVSASLCYKHDRSSRQYGDPETIDRTKGLRERGCVISTCDQEVHKVFLCHTHYSRASRFNLSVIQLEPVRLVKHCELCGDYSERLHFDHDHRCCNTGRWEINCGTCLRGVLCRRCNTTLGQIDALPEGLLAKMLTYQTTGDNA